jgi:MFS family permease
MTILDLFIVNVALPDIQRRLGATNAELQLVMIGYSLPYAALLMNAARLGDLFGRRKLFLTGMAVFALGSLGCALAPSPPCLIAGRVVQGAGAALLMPQVYTSLRVLFAADERRSAFAILGAVQGCAGVLSQLLGGCLIASDVGGLGWRLVFLINLPIALYALAAGPGRIPETRAPVAATLDIRGAVLGTSALVVLLLPVVLGQEARWPWWSIVLPLLSVPLVVAFIAQEGGLARRGGVPLVALSIFNARRFALGIVATFLLFSAISSFSLSLTILLQVGLGRTAAEAGRFFLPSTVAFFIGSLSSAPFARRSEGWALFAGLATFAAGLLLAVLVDLAGEHDGAVLGAAVMLQGLGQGIVIPLLLDGLLSTVSREEAGMASGVFATLQVVGSACGVTIVGTILFGEIERMGRIAPGLQPSASQFRTAFATATLYNLGAVLLTMLLLHLCRRGHPGQGATLS